MNHCVGDFDAGRVAVEDQPTHFGFQDSDQIGVLAQIFFCAVNGRGEVSLKRSADSQNLFAAGMVHQKRGWAENFRLQI